jgi:uncharacterized membrane protein YdjX (TVP38/TMEM64 family)
VTGRNNFRSAILRFIWFAVMLIGIVLILRSGVLGLNWTPEVIQQRVEAVGWAAPIIFVAGFAVLINLLIPLTAMAVPAGMAFGSLTALILGIPAIILSQLIGYLISAYFARNAVREFLRRRGWLGALESLESRSAVRISFAARFAPLSTGVQNYLLGLTHMPLGQYLAGSLAGSIPWYVVFSQIGATADRPLKAPFWVGMVLYFLLLVGADRWWRRREKRLKIQHAGGER